MPYCVSGPSVIPRSCPLFDLVWDGPKPSYDPRDMSKATLERCFPLGPDTVPPSTVLPSKAICCTAHKALPDFFGIKGRICISSAFKDIIDQLEPDAHQYFPIELRKKNKTLFEGEYFLFNILQTADSVIVEKSDFAKMRASPNSDWFFSSSGNARTFAADRLPEYHIWREKICLRNIYMSDQAMDLFKARKLRGFDYLNSAKGTVEL